jgi:hypothetical protein
LSAVGRTVAEDPVWWAGDYFVVHVPPAGGEEEVRNEWGTVLLRGAMPRRPLVGRVGRVFLSIAAGLFSIFLVFLPLLILVNPSRAWTMKAAFVGGVVGAFAVGIGLHRLLRPRLCQLVLRDNLTNVPVLTLEFPRGVLEPFMVRSGAGETLAMAAETANPIHETWSCCGPEGREICRARGGSRVHSYRSLAERPFALECDGRGVGALGTAVLGPNPPMRLFRLDLASDTVAPLDRRITIGFALVLIHRWFGR